MNKYLGSGLGLRPIYYKEILSQLPSVDWFEIISEDYMDVGGTPLYYLDKIRAHYPVVLHGVSLSIGSTDKLNKKYLKHLKKLADHILPEWISDHCCFTGVKQINMHDLLPLPYTEEALNHTASRIIQIQEFLGRQILIENVSSYVTYTHSTLTEWDFLSALAKKADCLLLLDINNIYVSSHNHGFSALDFINNIPVDRVGQFHLAGHTQTQTHIIDTHSAPISEAVWDLFKIALQRFGLVSTLIERDDHFPPLSELLDELQQLKQLLQNQQNQLSPPKQSVMAKNLHAAA